MMVRRDAEGGGVTGGGGFVLCLDPGDRRSPLAYMAGRCGRGSLSFLLKVMRDAGTACNEPWRM